MSGPHEPQQPGYQPYQPGYPGYPQPDQPPAGQYPGAYPQPGQPLGYPPAGQYPVGYPPAGFHQPGFDQPGYQRPRRPGVLIAAGVLWLLNGSFLLLFGLLTAVADRLPGFEQTMRDQDIVVTREQLLGMGITGAALGAAITGLGVVVFSGATWARVLVVAVAVVPTLFLLGTVIFPLVTIIAAVLQFLPPVTAYVRARNRPRALP